MNVRFTPLCRLAGALPALAVCLGFSALPAAAESINLTVNYSATISGISIGKAKIEARLNGNDYAISGTGKVAGISALFADGKGNVSVSGILKDRTFQPARYSQTIVDDKKETVDMTFADARVVDVTFTPPPRKKNPKKRKKKRSTAIPVTEEHKTGVIDPLSVFLLPADELTGEGICNRTLPLFDGEQRFNVVLTFDRKVERKGQDAYVCAAAYRPIAGHKPGKKSVKFMVNNKNMEVWLVPVGSSGYVAPVEAHVKTQYGMLVIKANKFQVSP